MISDKTIVNAERGLALLALTFPCLLGFLFFVGNLFSHGYFRYWNLHTGLFDWPINLVLLEGLWALITLGVIKGIVVTVVILMYFVAVYVAYILSPIPFESKFGRKIRAYKLRITRKYRNKKNGLENFQIPLMVTGISFLFAYFFTVFAIFFALFGSAIERSGFMVAQDRHLAMNPAAKQSNLSTTMILGIGDSDFIEVQGDIVRCVNQKCELLNGDTVFVIDFDREFVRSDS